MVPSIPAQIAYCALNSSVVWRWRFGLRSIDIVRELQSLRRSGWSPDPVLMTSLVSYWWLGVPIAVAAVRKVFLDATITLGGGVPGEYTNPRRALQRERYVACVITPRPCRAGSGYKRTV